MVILFFLSKCVNLDITTMVAYVSALTNGGCGFVFKVIILTRSCGNNKRKIIQCSNPIRLVRLIAMGCYNIIRTEKLKSLLILCVYVPLVAASHLHPSVLALYTTKWCVIRHLGSKTWLGSATSPVCYWHLAFTPYFGILQCSGNFINKCINFFLSS